MAEKFALAFAGALFGSTLTLIIQIFIVPRVQVGVRRQDRWERDVDELAVLVEDQLRAAYAACRSVGTRYREFKALRDDPNNNQDLVRKFLEEDERAEREAHAALADTLARYRLLERRLRRVRPKSPYWNRLAMTWLTLRLALFDVEPQYVRSGPELGADEYTEAWAKVDVAWKALDAAVKQISEPEPRRPPRRKLPASGG